VLIPSGCRDEDLKEQFLKLEGEAMCGNCGFFDRCQDDENSYFLARARRYADIRIDSGFYGSTAMSTNPVRFKGLDLDRWTVPDRSDRTGIVVLHSHAAENRNLMPGRNIKGTPIIDAVMERICSRHPHVEYRRVTGLKPAEMLAEQQAADIVIDQLFYGHWGSTGIEAMGVGCAVVCYLRPAWAEQFKRNFPTVAEIPVVSATKDTLENAIERLVTDRKYLRDVQAASRRFAEDFYDPETVSEEFEAMLMDVRRAGRRSV
jgi:glycosyltransferase involved in cell wall biosynthesis